MTPPATLAEVRAEAFRRLAHGVADRRSAFHTPALATLGPDGAPAIRTLVLRGFDPGTRTLALHTDRRSGKWAELAAEPRAALHAYDAAAQVQLRLSGRAALHAGDAVAAAAWAGSGPGSRLSYGIAPAPGTPVPEPPPAPREAEGGGEAHFAVILLRFDRMEWLHLHHAGHRRARFHWRPEGLEETWLVP